MLTSSPSSSRPITRRFRLLKAYGTLLRVLTSYLTLKLAGMVRGPDWRARKYPEAHRRNAHRVVRLILDLKGLFIKIGQLISILTNFLPEDFRNELEGLQDQIPARPLAEIQHRIRAEFGQDPSDLFASFEPVPIASASLAQVHEARLHDGRRVAVKVQHLYIEETARMDLRTIRNILGIVGTIVRIRGLDTQYVQLQTMILEELDFSQEALHIETMAANLEGHPMVSFPRVIHDRSTRRVLTTEYIDGVKVTDLDALQSHNIDQKELAEHIVKAYCHMIFTDGIYHADPHPGNIIVQPDGGIVFIDFGAVAQLSPNMKEGLPSFIMGLLRRDAEQIANALRQMGFVARNGHEDPISNLIDRIYDRVLADLPLDGWQLQDITAEATMEAKLDMLADFRKLGISFRDLTATFQVPKDWILLDRTLLLLMGLCTHLDPAMNPFRTIRPYLEEFILGPEKDWKDFLGSAVKDLAFSALTLPSEMQRLLAKTNRGEAEVRVRGLGASTQLIYALGHQLLYGLFALGSGTMSFLAHTRDEASLSLALAITSVFFLLCLGGSFLKARKWSQHDT